MVYGYYSSMIVLIPAIIFTIWAQASVKSNFGKYSRISNSKGITGMQAAKAMLDANGLSGIPINIIQGNALTNYYDPRNKTLNLSDEVYNTASITAMCVACHEVGHAIQDDIGYGPLRFRNTLVPVVNLTQNLAWPLIIIGMILTFSADTQSIFFSLGVLCFVFVVLFHLVTLPVEFNASNRALEQLQELSLVNDQDYAGSKKVLKAAAMTYVAALATALSNLLRILIIVGGRRD